MENIADIIRNRRSVRTFDGREIGLEEKEKLSSFMSTIDNPYKIPVDFKMLDAKKCGLNCPVVTGTDLYVAGKVEKVPYANEAFGYAFEMLVLYAWSLNIGTVWLGGTMNRAAYEKAMELGEDEMMPCASPLGYGAKKMSMREIMMRKAINANERMPFDQLFFEGDFNAPLTVEKAGILAHPLEMVRLAPSAVNKQPWRVIVCDNAVHFYLKRSKAMASTAIDIQKVDLGIALCHFDIAAKEMDLNVTFAISNPEIAMDSDVEYIATYLIKK